MAARGTESKQAIINKILEIFDGSFLCNGNKELRIPMTENGARVEIKVALTCAKENVGGTEAPKPITQEEKKAQEKELAQPNEEELSRVQKLLDSLNF